LVKFEAKAKHESNSIILNFELTAFIHVLNLCFYIAQFFCINCFYQID